MTVHARSEPLEQGQAGRQEATLKMKEVWRIRFHLQTQDVRDLALSDLAIDSKQ